MTSELKAFIQSNPDARELKRATAVEMYLQGYKHREIQDILGISSGFISKWTQIYHLMGVEGLQLAYQGSIGYLDSIQRQTVIAWLQSKVAWNLTEFQNHIHDEYGFVFKSKQSYYDLFQAAGISWKKTQKRNPKADPALVLQKEREITQWLEANRPEITEGSLVVFFQDECHLLWGDLCGYVWGKTDERIELPIVNERQKQTYYGVVNLQTQECLLQSAKAGNSEETLALFKNLLAQYPNRRIALIWDGASYHRSQAVKDYLAQVNQGLEPSEWRITCIRFAPNDPTQNPIEDIWLQAKRFIREHYHLCQSFEAVKVLFELVTHHQIFDFPKLLKYGCFS
jgi:putative transposase